MPGDAINIGLLHPIFMAEISIRQWYWLLIAAHLSPAGRSLGGLVLIARQPGRAGREGVGDAEVHLRPSSVALNSMNSTPYNFGVSRLPHFDKELGGERCALNVNC